VIAFIFINYTYFLSKTIGFACKFHSIKTKGGDATEKNNKTLIIGISRNFILLFIH
jgi:hypothetical protein